LSINDLPIISVVQDADKNYFTLNNRRLWVLKAYREQGLVKEVNVRLRALKPHEIKRYSIENCSLKATFMREKSSIQNSTSDGDDEKELITPKNSKNCF
jgi:hypothetical protein